MLAKDLQGSRLHYWVARAEGWNSGDVPFDMDFIRTWETTPETCLAIIEREKMQLFYFDPDSMHSFILAGQWMASVKRPQDEDRLAAGVKQDDEKLTAMGSTPMEAALRLRVMQVFGSEVSA